MKDIFNNWAAWVASAAVACLCIWVTKNPWFFWILMFALLGQ